VTDADLDAATILGEGWNAAALRVGELVVRVAKPDGTVEAFPREVALMRTLEAAGTPFVPRGARLLHSSGAVLAMTYQFIDGTPGRGGERPKGEARDTLARELGTFLGALHAFPLAYAVGVGVPMHELWADDYAPLLADCRPHLPNRTAELLDALAERFLAEGGTRLAPRQLIHADISGDHILLDADGTLAGVIDYEDAMIGDPALDFAGILNDWRPSFLERVFAHYPLPLDPDARRRAAFYIAVAPLHDLREAVRTDDSRMRQRALKQLARRVKTAVEPAVPQP
jgi:aminoglycoside 2''-phosphotransferase